MKRVAVVLVLAGTVAVVATGAAGAAEYTITTCQSDRSAYSSQAFEDFATRGMQGKRACDPEGPGLRGLVTSNVPRNGRVERGARSFFVLRAPEGTRFSKFTWSGQARRRDCRYALQLWAGRPDGPPVSIKNVKANSSCPKPGRAQAAGWPRPKTYDVNGATMIAQRAVCVGAPGKPFCSARGLNYIRTFKAEATVVDVTPPTVSILQDNPFTRGEWVRGAQTVNYDAADNVGVRLATPLVNGAMYAGHSRVCNYAQIVPCINGPGAAAVHTRGLREGSQELVVQAEDSAGNVAQSATATVRVDNTSPGAVVAAVTDGDGWRNLNAFSVEWTNPVEIDRAPIVAVDYRLCREDGTECTSGRQTGAGVSNLLSLAVPGPGVWELRMWREDAAGNQEPANASPPARLRFDPHPPRMSFHEQDPADPTRVRATVTDEVSGVAAAQIEITREGSGIWQTVPATLDGGHLTAHVDDHALLPGAYRVRASASDHAANLTAIDSRPDGTGMVLTLPLRVGTTMRAGVMSRSRSKRPKSRRLRDDSRLGKRRARIRVGGEFRVAGVLRDEHGSGLPGAHVQVSWTGDAGLREDLVSLQTDHRGRYSYTGRALSSGRLRFAYPGTARALPSEGVVAVVVPAFTTVAVRPRLLANGRSVEFRGRLKSLPIPPAGKLVELQVVLSGRWQTFRTLRSDSGGNWKARYRFRRSCGLLRYRFRARIPEEAGYPFAAGHSSPVSVEVRGRPCR